MPTERRSVHGADTADHAIGRRLLDEVGQAAPAALSGQRECAVLDETAWIDQVGHVLARGAPAHLATACHGIGPGGIEPHGVAGDRLGKVGANVVGVDGGHRLDHHGLHGTWGECGHRFTVGDGLASHHEHGVDDAAVVGLDGVMHLHRLDEHHLLPGAYRLSGRDVDGDDGALHRRDQVNRSHTDDGSCPQTSRRSSISLNYGAVHG